MAATTAAVVGAGAAVGGGLLARESAKEATSAQTRSADAAIAEQRAASDVFEERTQPFVDVGTQAAQDLQSFLADPSQQLSEINPIVSFLRNEGFEDIQESAAAGGRLGAGGTLQDLVKFNTQLATTVAPQLQQQRFNQLFNLAGLGSSAAAGQGSAALQTAGNVGNLLGNIGQAKAQGAIAQGQITGQTIGNLANIAGQFAAGQPAASAFQAASNQQPVGTFNQPSNIQVIG